MPYDPKDYTKTAIIARLQSAVEKYKNAGNDNGIAAAKRAIRLVDAANEENARQIEVQFNRGDFGDQENQVDRKPSW
jgi:hypothetical protein